MAIPQRDGAFSLIELLAAIAIMVTLAAIAIPAVGVQRAASLTQAGNMTADAAKLARQTAQSKNSITALIIEKKATPTSSQALILVEFNPVTEQWQQTCPYVWIPSAAQVVDREPDRQKIDGIAAVNLTVSGATLTDYSALVFYPDGRMGTSVASPELSVLPAAADSTAVDGALPNYYDLIFNPNTSALRIVRP